MARTEVMLIGAIPAGYTAMPGAGGPNQMFTDPNLQPSWLSNRTMVPPVSPAQPQNLMRVSDKSLSPGMASSGRPFTTALGGLMGGPTMLLGDAANGDMWKTSFQLCALGSMVMGATFASVHGYRRNRGNMGWTILWGLMGATLPLLTGGVALAQGYAKPK